tara:strand:- start:2164 stop:3468 length:1305 start_codon:yes stop_codon:yes gene_type:complete
MLVKFFNRGRGGGNGPADYLMGKDRDRNHAQVLRGDLEQTVELINGLSFARNYTSGCLSFAESDMSYEQKNIIMDSFQTMVFTGLERDQFDITWVEHKDKGRLELNFLIPNVELKSGKRYQPYYHQGEHKMMNSWQQLVNDFFHLKDPHDPRNKSVLTLPRDLPKSKEKVHELITGGLLSMAESGLIKDRSDVIQALQKSGFEIARQTKSSISIKHPDGGRNIKLKGALYEQNFRSGTELRTRSEAASREYEAGREQRIQQAKQVYQYGSGKKRERNEKRYGKIERTSFGQIQGNANYVAISRDHSSVLGRHVHASEAPTAGYSTERNNNQLSREGVDHVPRRNNGRQGAKVLSAEDKQWSRFKDILGRVNNHDKLRTAVNTSVRAASTNIRAAIHRIERETKRLSERWRKDSGVQEHNQRSSQTRKRENMFRM